MPRDEAGDDPVAAREMARLRGFAQAHFRNDHALILDRGIQFLVLRRIDDVDAARHHGHGAHRQRRFMRACIDAACQARHHRQTRQSPGRATACRRICAPGR